MTRFALEPSDRLIEGDRELRFEMRRGDELDFIDDKSKLRLTVTDTRLAEMIAEGDLTLQRGNVAPDVRDDLQRRRIADFSLQPTEERELARKRLAYVQSVISAKNGTMSETCLQGIIDETAKRREDPVAPTTRHVRRLIRRAGRTPVASQFVTATKAKGNRSDKLDHRVREILEKAIDDHWFRRPPVSVKTIEARVSDAINEYNKQFAAGLKLPMYDTIRQAVLRRPPRDSMAARYGEAAAQEHFDGVVTRKGPEAPLDVVELDHTKNDLFVICGFTFLPIGRPTIAVALDRRTRMPYGIYIGFDPPSVHTVMQCLRNGMLPKTYIDRKVEKGEWKIKHRWEVCGKPRILLLDRAMENIGSDLEDFAAEVGFHLKFAPRKRGAYKGSVERFLKTVMTQLMHEQRGTTFSNVLDRDDYDSAKHAVITLDELTYVLHRWMLDVYACGKHDGIHDVPMRLYKELELKYPVQPIEEVAKLNMLFGRTSTRTLNRKGVQFEYLGYYSEELVSLLSNAEFLRKHPNCELLFRWDPGDLSFIRVYDPTRKLYFKVPACERDEDYVRGVSIWQHRQIVKLWQRRLKENVDYAGIARAKVEIFEAFEDSFTRRGRISTRTRAARHDGVGRMSMAGDDEATSPVGSRDHDRRQAAAVDKTKAPRRKKREPPRETIPQLSIIPPRKKHVTEAPPVATANFNHDEEDLYAQLGISRHQ